MAATAAARRLTETHRLAQVRLGARTAAAVLGTWDLLDLEDLDGTVERWLRTVLPILRAQHDTSATTAANYLETFKRLELDASARTPVALASLNTEAATASMLVTGPRSVKSSMTRGLTLDRASDLARTRTAGAAMRHVLDGGRSTVTNTIAADRQALGWSRATSGDPCGFCAMLASRGPVYKTEETGGFPAHDHCMCATEPVYRRDADWPSGARRYQELWQETTRGLSGADARNAFRRAIEAPA